MILAGKYDESFRDPLTEEAFHRHVGQWLGAQDALSPEQITAIYLAYAMRQARRAIQAVPEHRDHDLDLVFNVAIPISHIQNNSVRPVFEHILAWAEAIEREWKLQEDTFDPLAFSGYIEGEVRYGSEDPGSFLRSDPEARVFAVPESVAQASSYLVSLQRQTGVVC